jgi:sigma-B regulation protein RsbU (phosphoserine phosphatase)
MSTVKGLEMPIRILVADVKEPDLEILIRQVFRKRIQEKEIEFIFLHEGSRALEFLQTEFDTQIVLTDVKTMVDDKRDLLSAIQEMKRVIKTVVITPIGDIESIRVAMNKGAFDFITRPINLKDLDIALMKTVEELKRVKEAEETQSKLFDIEKELDVAKSIQNSILPHDFKPFPAVASFEIYGTMLPAKRVGGDFFDFFPIDETRLAFTIADVSGKGVPAALFMTMTRGLLRALGQKTKSPVQCFQQLNELILLENDSSMFVTAFYAIYNTDSGLIEYCNAGHNPPYYISAKGELKQIGRCEGIALGVAKESSFFEKKELLLHPGDTLLLYTDGVTEAMDLQGELYQESRLESFLAKTYQLPLKELLNQIVNALKTFAKDREQSDDITLLALRKL